MNKLKFCGVCEKFLEPRIGKTGKTSYHCDFCKTDIPIVGNVIKYYKPKKLTSQQSMAETALYDNTLPRIRKKCKKCDNDVLIYYKDESTMRNVYICRTCGTGEMFK